MDLRVLDGPFLVVEILKGQVLFGFVHMFHSILIYRQMLGTYAAKTF